MPCTPSHSARLRLRESHTRYRCSTSPASSPDVGENAICYERANGDRSRNSAEVDAAMAGKARMLDGQSRGIRATHTHDSKVIRYDQQQGGAAAVTASKLYGAKSAAYTIALK